MVSVMPLQIHPDRPTCVHLAHFMEHWFMLKPTVLSLRKIRQREREVSPVPTIMDSAVTVCVGFPLVPVIQARNNPPHASFQVGVLSVSSIWHQGRLCGVNHPIQGQFIEGNNNNASTFTDWVSPLCQALILFVPSLVFSPSLPERGNLFLVSNEALEVQRW